MGDVRGWGMRHRRNPVVNSPLHFSVASSIAAFLRVYFELRRWGRGSAVGESAGYRVHPIPDPWFGLPVHVGRAFHPSGVCEFIAVYCILRT